MSSLRTLDRIWQRGLPGQALLLVSVTSFGLSVLVALGLVAHLAAV